MSNHTKGEWFAKRNGWSTVYIECRIGGGLLQEVAACGPTANGSAEQEANASLIAAAPDLLRALEAAVAFIECSMKFPDGTDDSNDAYTAYLDTSPRKTIAKAKGEI
jgi:hypothetical protein